MRYDHRQSFNQLLTSYGYTAKQIAAWSGVHESKISRFRNGKGDLEMGEMLRVLEHLPQEAQDNFWEQLLGNAMPIEQLIQGMSEDRMLDLLQTLAVNWKKSKQRPELHLLAQ